MYHIFHISRQEEKLTLALFSIMQQTKSFVTAAGEISRRVITELIASGENHGLV